MHRVIYVDTLIFLNTVITFIILLSVRQYSAVKTSGGRMLLASFLGGFFSLIILAPEINTFLTLVLKVLISCIIVFTAFYINGKKVFFRCFGLFTAVTFLYGGVMFFISGISGNGFVLYKNGYSYISLNFISLIILSTVLYFTIKVLKKRFFAKEESFCYDIKLFYNGKTVSGTALYDSGSFITDSYTGKPVIIAARDFVLPLLDKNESDELLLMSLLSSDNSSKLKVRLIPAKTVSGSKMLPAFTCDKAVIASTDKYCNVAYPCLAVVDDGFGPAEYEAIINENIFC